MSPTARTPAQLISVALDPRQEFDKQTLREVIKSLIVDDPELSFTVEVATGKIFVHGSNELHLDAAVGKILKQCPSLKIGVPEVAYREVLARPFEVDYTHNKRDMGIQQFARVKLRLEPDKTGAGNKFEIALADNKIPKECLPGIDAGIRSVWDTGVLIGFPLVDLKVTLLDGVYHATASTADAFEIATRAAMEEGCRGGGILIHEPIMDIEVVTPG